MLLALFSNGNSLAAAGPGAGLSLGSVLLEGALALPAGNRFFDAVPRSGVLALS
jgi:hypothetical protein